MTRAKICGIRDEVARDVAVAAGADAVGFVVEIPRSKISGRSWIGIELFQRYYLTERRL